MCGGCLPDFVQRHQDKCLLELNFKQKTFTTDKTAQGGIEVDASEAIPNDLAQLVSRNNCSADARPRIGRAWRSRGASRDEENNRITHPAHYGCHGD